MKRRGSQIFKKLGDNLREPKAWSKKLYTKCFFHKLSGWHYFFNFRK